MFKKDDDLARPKQDRLGAPGSKPEKAVGMRRPQLKLRYFDDPSGQESLPEVKPGR